MYIRMKLMLTCVLTLSLFCRIQFKHAPGASTMFAGQDCAANELVMRLQPDEAVYLKANVKSPGLKTTPLTSELDLSYATRYADEQMFDAYTRLILEVIRGRQATFVRDDELKAAWKSKLSGINFAFPWLSVYVSSLHR